MRSAPPMKSGCMRPGSGLGRARALAPLGQRAHVAGPGGAGERGGVYLAAGDQALIMSNGGFGGVHARLLEALRSRRAQ